MFTSSFRYLDSFEGFPRGDLVISVWTSENFNWQPNQIKQNSMFIHSITLTAPRTLVFVKGYQKKNLKIKN